MYHYNELSHLDLLLVQGREADERLAAFRTHMHPSDQVLSNEKYRQRKNLVPECLGRVWRETRQNMSASGKYMP